MLRNGGMGAKHRTRWSRDDDRILIATAREFAAPLVTRDREMLAYGEAGNVSVLAC
jgi:PIN domain nuclease of toxin-antitoxin system